MQYFDIIVKDIADQALVRRLGYRRIFVAGKDIDVSGSLSGDPRRKMVIVSRDPGVLIRATRERRVLGIMFEGNELIAKAMMAARENGKLVMLSTEGLSGSGTGMRLSTIYKLRRMVAELRKAHVKTVLVTMAGSREMLQSRAQMIQLARFLGAAEAQSREMVSSLGDAYDN